MLLPGQQNNVAGTQETLGQLPQQHWFSLLFKSGLLAGFAPWSSLVGVTAAMTVGFLAYGVSLPLFVVALRHLGRHARVLIFRQRLL